MKHGFAYILLLSLFVVSCSSNTRDLVSSTNSIHSIDISEQDQNLLYNEEVQLTVKDSDGNAVSNDKLNFSSTNDKVATVTSEGLVKALDTNASCFINVSLKDDASVQDKIKISVKSRVLVNSIDVSSDNIYLAKNGGYINFTYEVLPSNATDKSVDIYVENPEIATLNSEKNQIKALASGTTNLVIKAKETFSKVEKKIPVTVNQEGYVDLKIDEALSPTKYFTYNDMLTLNNEGGLMSVAPKEDPAKVLVLPIEFTDYPFRENIKSELDTLFNSEGKSQTNYWESVSSFYEKSSFGKLNLSFDIADTFKLGKKALEAIPDAEEHQDKNYTEEIVEKALANYKSLNSSVDMKKYDRNKDGTIDAVWAIYSAPDYSQKDVELNSRFWAFVSSNEKKGNVDNPILNRYGWASYDFMDHAGSGKIDSHTYIHETGHLLGLDDYYNYNQLLITNSPLGVFDMMDSNVGDNNAWSKMALGWETPFVYDYSKEKTARVHLKPNDQGTSLIITDKYKNTAFDEFLVLELYSPKGLNSLDSSASYEESIPQMPNEYGVKMYHVDARLISEPTDKEGTKEQVYYDLDNLSSQKVDTPVMIGASNTPLYPKNYTKEKYSLITLISSKKTGGDYLNQRTNFTSQDLFYSNSVFDTDSYSLNTSIFEENKGFVFNDGTKLNIRITFEKVDSSGADIRIEPLH